LQNTLFSGEKLSFSSDTLKVLQLKVQKLHLDTVIHRTLNFINDNEGIFIEIGIQQSSVDGIRVNLQDLSERKYSEEQKKDFFSRCTEKFLNGVSLILRS
jgi:hypothetical protein